MHPPTAYHSVLADAAPGAAWDEAVRAVDAAALRTALAAPGFALVTFRAAPASETLRRAMIRLKEALSTRFHRRSGRYLVYRSMARFDQQMTTKFHLDGGPDESVLILGYEPSTVDSRLALADYTLAAQELGIEPAQFMAEHNPMFTAGAKLLERFTTPLTAFDPRLAHILIVNNSSRPFDPGASNLLGVMHQATVPRPDASQRRVVNSTMVLPVADPRDEEISSERQAEFATTPRVSGSAEYAPS